MENLRFGSVCSGIEAASVAWEPLGWKAAWFAEIEPFPCAVLAHHYPNVPNLGDMSKLPGRVLSGEIEAPDVFCGGTPCQAFSVAGLRRSLDDARGNLSLVFCEIANAIDSVRSARGEQPSIIFWENVPGVLSTADNAFGCFLSGLAGEDDPLVAPGGKWTNAGVVLGPKRAIAWRVTDAQYFGVAQRRRRVFVVASARDGFDPATVLFEWDGVRRDSAPSRDAGQGSAIGTLGGTSPGGGWRFGADEAAAGQLIQAFGGNNTAGPIDVATARNACASASGRMDFESETFLVQPTIVHGTQDPCVSTETAFALGRNNGGENVLAFAFAQSETPFAVRRLTVEECEFLQGFPRGYTAIPWRKKPASDCPDGPRYKALGNSWAVPCVRWIGRRIQAAIERRGAT